MNPHEKRRKAMRVIANTLEAVAIRDDTISKRKLTVEIMHVFEVSEKTAKDYIKEIVHMGIAKEDGDFLWHSKEKEVKLNYLERKANADKQESQL